MSFDYRGRQIRKVGVIGSGQIGPDIALYFTKVFHRHGVPVVVVDVVQEALERGRAKVERKVEKGIETKAFAPEEGRGMVENLQWTRDYQAVADCDLVVEAATESRDLKGKIFKRLESLCSSEAILVSNSSHMEPEVIFSSVERKGRSLVIHYFFPAERNLLVEIVPGRDTRAELVEWLLGFYEAIGKVPIRVASRYGYAVDPIFEGLFQAAALLVEEGLGTTREVDAVACRTLGLAVGPFTAMNLTGGNPITRHGLDIMREKIMPWFGSPAILARQMEAGTPWEVPARGEKVAVGPERERRIAETLTGAYLGLAFEVLESGIVEPADLEMGVELALDMTPPLRLANRLGPEQALDLVQRYADAHPGFRVAEMLRRGPPGGGLWRAPTLIRKDSGGVAVLTIRRPRALNALDGELFAQIDASVREVARDESVRAVVLTGFGVKAFSAGADVAFLSEIDSPEKGERTSRDSQRIADALSNLGKPVVCAMNGFAFGGGLELAMACTARLCRKGLPVLAAQPEVNLGIIPGAGGTQRLARLVGLERAAALLRTGRPVSSKEAVSLGLVSAEVEGDLVPAAVDLALRLADGRTRVEPLRLEPLADVPETLPQIELGHLSRRIDQILCEAILGGARRTLEDGLAWEAKKFGECVTTEDMRIGIRNFLEKGPKSKAPFVHR